LTNVVDRQTDRHTDALGDYISSFLGAVGGGNNIKNTHEQSSKIMPYIPVVVVATGHVNRLQ